MVVTNSDNGEHWLVSTTAYTLHTQVDLVIDKTHVLLWFLGALRAASLILFISIYSTTTTVPWHFSLLVVETSCLVDDNLRSQKLPKQIRVYHTATAVQNTEATRHVPLAPPLALLDFE
jgi:hypothetical protein